MNSTTLINVYIYIIFVFHILSISLFYIINECVHYVKSFSRGIIVCVFTNFLIPRRIYTKDTYDMYDYTVQKTLYTSFIKRCHVHTKVHDMYEYRAIDSSSYYYRVSIMDEPSRCLFLSFLAYPCLIGCFVGFAKLVWLPLSWVVKIRFIQQVLDA